MTPQKTPGEREGRTLEQYIRDEVEKLTAPILQTLREIERERSALIKKAALATELQERLRYADLSVREILSDFGFSAHPEGIEIVSKLNRVSEILSGYDSIDGKAMKSTSRSGRGR